MVIHIAPIGKETKHVEEWLREVTPVTKIWLIHSKKKDGVVDFSKYAKNLAKKLKKDYSGIEIKSKIIDNPFGMNDTMKAITEIVEIEKDAERQDFAINVTGGTNVMATGAILSAMLLGTKAYYVLNRDKNPGQKKYVDELPIPNIGIIKMNKTQQKVLNIISKSSFTLKDPESGKEETETGVITNQDLLNELKESQITGDKRKRQKGATKLNYITSQLRKKKLIEKIHGVERYEEITEKNSKGFFEKKYVKVKNESKIKWAITPQGEIKAKDFLMKDSDITDEIFKKN